MSEIKAAKLLTIVQLRGLTHQNLIKGDPMKYYDIGAIEDGFELPVGARFRFRDTLFEVVEANEPRTNPWGCSKCAFNGEGAEEACLIMKCDGYGCSCRHDQKYIYFKEVGEENSD